MKARAQAWINSGGRTAADDEEDEESALPGGRMAAGEGASQPKDWSVPKSGEAAPPSPTIPSTRNAAGVRIIIPATISCYPILELEKPKGDDIGPDDEIRIRSVNRYRGWRNALRAYVACL